MVTAIPNPMRQNTEIKTRACSKHTYRISCFLQQQLQQRRIPGDIKISRKICRNKDSPADTTCTNDTQSNTAKKTKQHQTDNLSILPPTSGQETG